MRTAPSTRAPPTDIMRSALALLVLGLLLAGCTASTPAAPIDDFAGDASPGQTFPLEATGGYLAAHLTVEKEGRVAYRVLAREGARIDACLIPGWDAQLWWANHTVPTESCSRGMILATAGATLPPGPLSLAIHAYGCPDNANCTVTMWTKGATLVGTALGPVDARDVESAQTRSCAVC